MLTAHLPSGYVLWRSGPKTAWAGWLPVGLIGAVLPDIDMVFFYLVDHKAFHHHTYWVHIPLFWAVLAVLTVPMVYWLRRVWIAPTLLFYSAILLHLVLDSIGGGVMWGAPFSDALMTLVAVPARHGHWITNFIVHWTFLAELAIWVVAGWLMIKDRRA